ncbi:MAG: hypothetical protein RLN90_15155 [Balneolaceae bacterium]
MKYLFLPILLFMISTNANAQSGENYTLTFPYEGNPSNGNRHNAEASGTYGDWKILYLNFLYKGDSNITVNGDSDTIFKYQNAITGYKYEEITWEKAECIININYRTNPKGGVGARFFVWGNLSNDTLSNVSNFNMYVNPKLIGETQVQNCLE